MADEARDALLRAALDLVDSRDLYGAALNHDVLCLVCEGRRGVHRGDCRFAHLVVAAAAYRAAAGAQT